MDDILHNLTEKKSEFTDHYRYANDYWSGYVQDASVYTLAQAGYTWNEEELRKFRLEKRDPLEFNIMRRPQEFFSGYLRDNLNQVIYSPFEGSDESTTEQLTKLSYYIWDKGHGYRTFLNAADECFKSGMSLCGLQMDYSKDFVTGDISFYKRMYNQFLLDPTFESLDLSDCGFAIMRDLVNKQNIPQLLPDLDKQLIEDLPQGNRDDKFMRYHPQFATFARNKNLVAYDQHYVRITKSREMLVDLDSGYFRDITDLDKEEKDKLKHGLGRLERLRRDPDMDQAQIPHVEIRRVDRPFVELNVFLNGEHVYQGPDKTGIEKTYPFVPLICYMEPSIWMSTKRIQGLASVNWSLQRQFNKRHMKILDMMDSDIATGFKYLIGSVPDPSDMQQSGQNKLIGIDPDNAPEGLNSVQQLTGGGANPVLIEYQKILDELSLTLSNVTESVMGIDEGGNTQVSGRLAQVRVAQGLRGNRKVFDGIEDSQQLLGGLVLECIQAKYPAGKVQRIINEEPTQQFYDSQFEQYDAVIKEGIRSKSQKDAHYYEMVNLKREQIIDVPESAIIEAYPGVAPKEFKEAIERQEEQRAEQQEKVDRQEAMALELDNAHKEEMLGLAQERRGRVLSDIALAKERSSEAEENRAQAALARAKTITEIATLEDERIIRVLEFVNLLEAEEKADRDVIDASIAQQAEQINSETEGSAENKQLQQAQQIPQVPQAQDTQSGFPLL